MPESEATNAPSLPVDGSLVPKLPITEGFEAEYLEYNGILPLDDLQSDGGASLRPGRR